MNDSVTPTEQSSTATFADLGIHNTLRTALERLNMAVPTDIQVKMIPHALAGRDCLARVSTGAGKTNAYLLPILQTITPGDGLQALVIQPTRALALQLQRNIGRFSPDCEVATAVAGGGRRRQSVSDLLEGNPDIVIATVRGAEELAGHADADFSHLRYVVIDEADAITEECDPERVRKIAEGLPESHQTFILAGSWTEPVEALAAALLHEPARVEADATGPRAHGVRQTVFEVPADRKLDVLISYCKQEKPKLTIVLLRPETDADEVLHHVDRARISCRRIDERRKGAREARGRSGRRPQTELIFASDPPPRRLSTIPATHLIHYDLPADADTYIHRLEQAARLRRRGEVIAFVEPDEAELLEEIEQRLGHAFERAEAPEPRKRSSRHRGERDRSADRREKSDSRRERGDRRGGRSARGADGRSKSPRSEATPPQPRGRLNQLLYRDPDLEARGIRPPRRTLGARFRTNRRPRPLRRPD